MNTQWKELQHGITTKWTSSSIEYTFLQFLPDYYLDGSGYASWYDDIANTTQGFQSFTNKQQESVYFILESVSSPKITGSYADNISYRVSFPDVVNFTFDEKIQTATSLPLDHGVGEITFLNAEFDISNGEEGFAYLPDTFGFAGNINQKGDVITDQDNPINLDSNLDLGDSGFWIQIHELGHAFGGLLDVHQTTLNDSVYDSMKYTMMSYETYGGLYASGLQLLDIKALQDTYGTVNTNTRAGDTVYALGQGLGFSGASPSDGFLYTIWDGAGDDYLNGGSGSDTLNAGNGNDVLNGGLGYDHFWGGLGDDTFVINENNGGYTGGDTNAAEGGDDISELYDDGGTDAIILEDVTSINDVDFTLTGNAITALSDWNNLYAWDLILLNTQDAQNGAIEYLVVDNTIYDLVATGESGSWVEYTVPSGGVNETAPTAKDDVVTLPNGGALVGNVLNDNGFGADYDVDGTYLSVSKENASGNDWSIKIFNDGSFSAYSTVGYVGTHSVSYTLTDADGNSDTADLVVNFDYSNVAPVVGTMDDTLDVQTGKSFTFNTNFTDSDSVLSYSAELVDGSPLPDGIQIDADTGVLSGIVPNVLQDIEIRITASDGLASASHVLTLAVSLLGTDAQDYLHGNDEANVISAEAGDDFVYGYLGDDILSGDDGNDYIYGHEGNDTLDGGTGNDVLFGLQNDDSLYGGAGDDFLYGDDQDGLGTFIDGGNDTLYGGDGDDKLVGGNGNDVLHGGANGDTLFGNDGQDTLNGDNGDDFLYGGDGIDTLQGGAGRDRLAGDQGDDTLYGGDDRDTLFGGDGDDVIRGGTGIDSLYGNDGADTFVYQQGDVDGSRDYILDFSIAQRDTIDISDVIDFSSANGDDITDFVLLGGGSSYVRINIDQDGSGNAHSVQAVAQITNNTGWDLSTLIANGTLVVE